VILSRLLTLGAAALGVIATLGATSDARATWPMWALTIAVGVAAAVRPPTGLLLMAGFAPLGGAIGALAGLRASWTEPLVLSVLAGWLLRRSVGPPFRDALAVSLAGLMALAVLTSLLVQCAVAYQVLAPDGLSFARAMLQWLPFEGTIPREALHPRVTSAIHLLAGTALFVMAAEVCRDGASVLASALRMLTAGVAGVAALSLVRFIEVAFRQGTGFVPAVRYLHSFLRVSSTIADLNAAGAMFALVLPVAAVLAWRRPSRWLGSVALLLVGAGLWLSASRAAMLGAAIVVVSFTIVLTRRHWSWQPTAAVVALLVVGGGAFLTSYSRMASHGSSYDAWVIREQLAMVGFQMARKAPAFGVGIGQFSTESAGLASPELRQYYSAENAHNQFIQILGELGAVGAGLFVALIACSLIPAWRQGVAHRTVLMSALISGLVSFVVASLLMHPLLTPEVSAAFWICLGLARSAAVVPALAVHPPFARAVVPAVAAVCLLVSLPARIAGARNALDLTGEGIGLSAWRTEPEDGRRYRVAAGRAAIYVDGRAGRLRVPLRASGPHTPAIDIVLSLEGRPAGRVLVEAEQWTEFAMLLPAPRPGRPRFLRLDLDWTSQSSRARLDIGRIEYPGHEGL
jgi:hypothetical protein